MYRIGSLDRKVILTVPQQIPIGAVLEMVYYRYLYFQVSRVICGAAEMLLTTARRRTAAFCMH